MSRARAQSGPTISLFPFLAVLLCTMGSLLVVLVIFSRSARQAGLAAAEQARAEAEAASVAQREELELAREELGWRIDQTHALRDRTAEDLAKARMQLAGTEETARQLADELDALARVAEALESEGAAGDDAEILDLERRLAEARKALDDAKEKLAERPPAYAIVPYEGANGTHRRPLYIECCIDGVFLQPEGIRLGPSDFEGPPGPGNPLASALRAAREYIAKRPDESGDPNVQPYPLLLVRPSGVMAYYAAREAIQSWGSEFGYQFIDEEWTLNYPPRDAALADAEMRAVEEARRRLEWLAQVRPPKRTKPATQYRAATSRGGVVSNSGPSVLGDQSRYDWTEEQAGAGGSGGGAPGRGFNAGGGQGDGSLASDAGGGDAILGNRYAGPSKFYSGGPGGAGSGGTDSGAGAAGGEAGLPGMAGDSGDGRAAGALASDEGGHGGASSGGSTATSSWDGLAQSGSAAPGSAAAGGAGAGSLAAGAATAGQAAAGTSGGGSGGGAGASGSSGGVGGGGGGSGPSMPGLAQGGGAAASAEGGSGASASLSSSLAGKRGSNWASLATMETPVPLTRPIKVECAADEFRIIGDGGRVQSRIPIGTHTVDAIDPLVRDVHATVGRWGLAGDRMYWKPELVLSATPDGEGRRQDLERLLADSGIDTRRSEVKDKVRNLPPVQRTGGIFPRR